MSALTIFEGLYPNEKSKPDEFKLENFNVNTIAEDFVVSRDKDGNIISKFKDDTWDFSNYKLKSNKARKIHFSSKLAIGNSTYEAKKLLILYLLFNNGKNDSAMAFNTILGFVSDLILPIIEYAKVNKLSINTVIENNKYLSDYIDKKCYSHGKIKSLSAFLFFLIRTDINLTSFNFKEDKDLFVKIKKIDKQFRSKEKQTLVIPSRILNNATKERWKHIKLAIDNIDKITKFLHKYLSDKYFGTSLSRKIKTKDRNVYFWDKAANLFALENLFAYYDVHNRRTFQIYIDSLKTTCRHLIHTYSGMRESEVLSLMTNCLRIENDTYFLIGITSKLEATEKKAKWITSKEIEKVIDLIVSINKITTDHYNISMDDFPLFAQAIPESNIATRMKNGVFMIRGRPQELPIEESLIRIKLQDIEEIEEILFNQNIEELRVNATWKFKTHQYRRSLAVYAIQSGLVSLGALQIQFKHLFKEMTLYYANGASYARKLFDVPNNHIANDFDKLKPEIETLEYIKNVIFSDEQLFGTHGTFIERNVKNKNTSQKNYILENREKTLQQFKKGEIAYKETALGGCISTGACDYALTRSIVACGGCDSSIIKKSKLDNVINKQKEFIEFLDKDSIEYRTEMRDLEELEKQRKQFLGSKA